MAKMNQHFTRSECTLDGELAFENSDILSLSSQFSLLIPLKTSENLWFSDVFRGIKMEHWEEKG